MRTIQVVQEFDSSNAIGTMVIDETKLPPGDGYVFALAYLVKKSHVEDGKPVVDEMELYQVSLMSDERYLAYLKSVGKA